MNKPLMVILIGIVAGCGNPVFHQNKGTQKGAPDGPELIPFSVDAGNWSLQIFARREDGPVKATAVTAVSPSTASFTFDPPVAVPFTKTEVLPLIVTLEEMSCADAASAVAANGKVWPVEHEDTSSTSYAEPKPGQFFKVELDAVKRGDFCALMTFKNLAPATEPPGPFPVATGLIAYFEVTSMKHRN